MQKGISVNVLTRRIVKGSIAALSIVVAICLFIYLAFPQTILTIAASAQRKSAGMTRDIVRIGDWDIPYFHGGRANGENFPIVFVHGFGDTKHTFVHIGQRLSNEYEVYALDLPGFGETAIRPNEDYGPELYQRTLAGFLDKLQLTRVHLVGHSMGGAVAAVVAQDDPARVATLSLFAPAGVNGAEPSELEEIVAAGGENPLFYETREQFERLLGMAFNDPPEISSLAMRGLVSRGAQRNEVYREIFADLQGQRDQLQMERCVQLLDVPTLVVWGDEDRVVSVSAADRWKELNPAIEVNIIAGEGHAIVNQYPGKCAEWLRQHMQGFSHNVVSLE
ncbi:MAG: alpha/beta fold hydrolase [Planctomycetales bacterium]|nr:alpha/beta fold hydrolase [Planctomycetales bacterium]